MLGTEYPKVSVVIPTYNRANLLSRTVQSVLAQTFADYEIIIIDDCSKDNTQTVISKFDDLRIRPIRHDRNKGASAARNTGIRNAWGEYIAFLDDDDEWLPTNLEDQVQVLDSSSDRVGLVYGWMDTVEDSSGRLIPDRRNTISGEVFEDALGFNSPPTPTILVRLSVAREVGGFDESLSIHEDSDFFLRICQRYEVGILPKVVAKRHVEHGYDRLSDNTSDILLASSKILKAHMTRFSSELDQHPKARSAILRYFAVVEMMRVERWQSAQAFLTSIKLDPRSGETLVYSRLMLKLFIWYATPLRKFRRQARNAREFVYGHIEQRLGSL